MLSYIHSRRFSYLFVLHCKWNIVDILVVHRITDEFFAIFVCLCFPESHIILALIRTITSSKGFPSAFPVYTRLLGNVGNRKCSASLNMLAPRRLIFIHTLIHSPIDKKSTQTLQSASTKTNKVDVTFNLMFVRSSVRSSVVHISTFRI